LDAPETFLRFNSNSQWRFSINLLINLTTSSAIARADSDRIRGEIRSKC